MSARLRRAAGAAVLAAGALAVTGCSQIGALAQVSGVPLATVRTASYDVLVDKDVAILTAPVCTETTEEITCLGRTVDGSEIRVVAPTAKPLQMTVTVGGRELYRGSVQQVLDDAASR